MKLLVWQWGRRGAGPRIAVALAEAVRQLPDETAALSLSMQSELLQAPDGPVCELPFSTYETLLGFAVHWPLGPLRIRRLAARIAALRVDAAICAMPAPLDLVMVGALRRAHVPIAAIVHDADAHPGDGLPMQMALQRALLRRSDLVVSLTGHVARRIAALDQVGARTLVRSRLPPVTFGAPPPPPRAHGGPLRLLSFGRLLPYKGLDLLAEALRRVLPRPDLVVRVVGTGPESRALAQLRALPGVTVENRWVAEGEVGALLAWADVVVLSHTEASQSGVAAAALAAGRWIIATRVGGIGEQLAAESAARLCEPEPDSLAAALSDVAEGRFRPPIALLDTAAEWRRTAADIVQPLADLVARRRASAGVQTTCGGGVSAGE